MSNALILDLLFVVFVLLFSLIGFSRGIVKEGLASAGILFGALLADSWSARFGTIGSNLLNITNNAGRFFAVESLILASALVIGYGSGSLAVPDVRGFGARFGGTVLGAINGALLLAFSLRAAHEFIGRPGVQELLHDSIVSRVLIQRFNWFLLAITGLVLAMIFGRLVTEREQRIASPPSFASRERRPARLPAPGEAAKLEPAARDFNAETQRFHADAPDPLQTEPSVVDATHFSLDKVFREDKAPDVDADAWRTIRFDRPPAAVPDPIHAKRCLNCGESLSGDDAFCPVCGEPAKPRKEEMHDADS